LPYWERLAAKQKIFNIHSATNAQAIAGHGNSLARDVETIPQRTTGRNEPNAANEKTTEKMMDKSTIASEEMKLQ
jgi:hypothetical protein